MPTPGFQSIMLMLSYDRKYSIHSWALTDRSMTSSTRLTMMPECRYADAEMQMPKCRCRNADGRMLMPECRCRNANAGMPMPECQCQTTAGAVSIATIVRKTAGTKIEISPLRYMIETSGFFHCTDICSSNIIERKSFKIFNRFADM